MSQTMREALSNARAQIVTLGGVPDPVHGDDIQRAVLEQIDAALSAPSSEQGAKLPTVPDDVTACINAYGDSRADNDGLSGLRIGELVLALRRWGRSLASRPAATTPAVGVTVPRDVLEGMEWYCAQSNTSASCPCCGNMQHWGHKDGCELAAALAGAAQRAEPVPVVDYCTDPDNCNRCKTHPKHRGDMEHAGIGKRPQPLTGTEKKA